MQIDSSKVEALENEQSISKRRRINISYQRIFFNYRYAVNQFTVGRTMSLPTSQK